MSKEELVEKLDELANDTEVDMYSVATLNAFFEECGNTIRGLLEEIQQYRVIGTVEEIQRKIDALKYDCTRYEEQLSIARGEKQVFTDDDMLLEEYRAIDTIEEFKSLKEKSVAKKPHSISIANDIGNSMVECPICHANSDYAINIIKSGYCWKCGQKLEW